MAADGQYVIDISVDVKGAKQAQKDLDDTGKKAEDTAKKISAVMTRLKNTRLRPVVEILDRASPKLKTISQAVSKLPKAAKIAVEVTDKATTPIKKMFGALNTPLGLLGAGAALGAPIAVLTDSLGKAMDFEAQMSSIQALTGATAQQMQQMQTLALQMGAKTKYSALEAAQGIEELLKAGLTPAQVQAGGLEAALNLAAAGGLQLADAAEIMSTALNTFQRDGLSASKAADILAGTANASATSVEELRYSLAAVGSVAAGVGLSFQDTAAALGLFANNGLKGSDAGTSLKTMLTYLIPQSKQAENEMRKLGIITADGANRFFDASGKIKSMADIAQVLQDALKGLTEEQRLNALQTMFGTDAIRGANILFKEGAQGVKEFTTEMLNVTALDVARQKMNNAAGAVEQFQGAIETLQISALLPTLPIITKLANAAADFVTAKTPQIVDAVNRMVDQAKAYVREHFLNNPEFRNLSISGKVWFVFQDLMTEFNKWLDSGGQEQINQVVTTLVNVLSKGLDAAAPTIASVALHIGKAIGGAVIDGFLAALSDSWVGSIIAGAVAGGAIGSVIPGVGTGLGIVIGGAGGALYHAGSIMQSPKPGPAQKTPPPAPSLPSLNSGSSWHGLSSFMHHAAGGILTRPHIGVVAEEGPEAIIPLGPGRRSRAFELWQQVGSYIGAGGPAPVAAGAGGINVYVDSVNVHSANLDSDEEALRIGRIFLAGIKQSVENRR